MTMLAQSLLSKELTEAGRANMIMNMNALYEREKLGAIECHQLLGEYEMARELENEYNSYREGIQKKIEHRKPAKKDQVFEGTLVAAGWDEYDHVNQSSLYTQEDEDILLEHSLGMKKFNPYINQKVRIWGDVITTKRDVRRLLVKKISRLLEGFSQPLLPLKNEFSKMISPTSA